MSEFIDSSEDFEKWLSDSLDSLQLDSEVYVEYVTDIMKDKDEGSVKERTDIVMSILSGATEESLDEFKNELQIKWDSKEAVEQKQLEEDKLKKLEVEDKVAKALEKDKLLALEIEKQKAEDANKSKKELSEEERQARDRLIKQYGFQDDDVDEDGNPLEGYKDNNADDEEGGGNANKAWVTEQNKAKREKLRDEHQKKVIRDKELLARDKMRKEQDKQKKKTVRKERGR